VAERDAAAVRVGPVRRQPELPDHGERLRCEGLVNLEQVDVVQLEAGPLEHRPHRGYRADAHDPRLHASVGIRDEPARWRAPTPFGMILARQHHGGGGIVDA